MRNNTLDIYEFEGYWTSNQNSWGTGSICASIHELSRRLTESKQSYIGTMQIWHAEVIENSTSNAMFLRNYAWSIWSIALLTNIKGFCSFGNSYFWWESSYSKLNILYCLYTNSQCNSLSSISLFLFKSDLTSISNLYIFIFSFPANAFSLSHSLLYFIFK